MDAQTIGKFLVVAGIVVVVIGGALWGLGRMGLPLGRLPGDIRIERQGFSFYFPLATSILVSIALTVLVNILLRLFKK
jgi:Protein of unknown function (DUF2905)